MLTADNARQMSHDVRLNSIIDIYSRELDKAVALGKRVFSAMLSDLAKVVINPDEHDSLLLEAAEFFKASPRNFTVTVHNGRFLYSAEKVLLSGGACLYFDLSW